MTVDELRALVRQTTMVDSGDISDAQLLLWINDGIDDVSQRYEWPWLETQDTFSTADGTQAYALSGLTGDIQEILWVIITGEGEPLYPISAQAAYVRWGDDFPDGDPQYFFVSQESINVVPTPTEVEVVKVYYVKAPAELTQATDEPEWQSTFHNVLLPYVEAKLWEQQEDFAKANVAYQRYESRIDLMKRAYSSRVNHGPWTIGAARSTRTGLNEPFRNAWSVTP